MKLHPEFIYENENKENFDSRILDTTIEELDLTIRAYHVLKRNSLLTVRDIINFGPYNIIELRNAGKKTAKEVLDTILSYIQVYNISRPDKNSQHSSIDVNTDVPGNHSTFEDLIKRTFNQDLLNTPIDELDISVRPVGALRNAGCKTIEDIVNLGLNNLRGFRNVGRTTIEEIKNAILKHCEWETNRGDAINSIDTINSILASVSPKHLDIIKSRYGYRDGKRQTLEEIASKKGITRERVRQIIVKEISKMKLKRLKPLLEAVEGLLHEYNGVISIDEILRGEYFKSGNRYQARFLVNLLIELYKERYRVIYKEFLTSLSYDQIEALQKNVRKATVLCDFPITKRGLIKKFIASNGLVSERYLIYQLVNLDRIEVVGQNVLSPGGLSIANKTKVLLKNINKPLHFTEIAALYKSHFGDAKIKAKDLEHALHARIGDSKDFIIVNPGTFVLREKFEVPNNIKEIVNISKEVLRNLKTISDTRYLMRELKKRKIDTGNFNEYSLKSVLLEYPGFVSYKKFAIGIEEFADKYERKYLRDLIHEILLLSSGPLHLKEIMKEVHKKRGFKDYVVAKCLYDNPEFIKLKTSTYTVKEKVDMYEEKRNKIISFVKEWMKLKTKPISAFFVCEVLKEAGEVKDLPLGLVESVIATSPEFIRLPNGFYDLTHNNYCGN